MLDKRTLRVTAVWLLPCDPWTQLVELLDGYSNWADQTQAPPRGRPRRFALLGNHTPKPCLPARRAPAITSPWRIGQRVESNLVVCNSPQLAKEISTLLSGGGERGCPYPRRRALGATRPVAAPHWHKLGLALEPPQPCPPASAPDWLPKES